MNCSPYEQEALGSTPDCTILEDVIKCEQIFVIKGDQMFIKMLPDAYKNVTRCFLVLFLAYKI